MYPNMCFSNTIYELPTEEAEEELKKVLSEEEMAEILESGNYEIHFRFAEWFFGDKKQYLSERENRNILWKMLALEGERG